MFKSLSLRLKKASSRNEANLMLFRAWYMDHQLFAKTFVQQHIMEEATSVATNATSVPAKRQRTAVPGNSDPPKNLQSVKVKTENGTLDIPAFAKAWFQNNMTQKQVDNVMNQHYADNEPLFRKLFARICRNCYVGGRGLKNHTISQCYGKGNTCYIKCPKCNVVHWLQDCKVKK